MLSTKHYIEILSVTDSVRFSRNETKERAWWLTIPSYPQFLATKKWRQILRKMKDLELKFNFRSISVINTEYEITFSSDADEAHFILVAEELIK